MEKDESRTIATSDIVVVRDGSGNHVATVIGGELVITAEMAERMVSPVPLPGEDYARPE